MVGCCWLLLFAGNNSFGEKPTQALAFALKKNVGLNELDLSYNSLTPLAATGACIQIFPIEAKN